jgi:ATPase family associated with various cellular activities (AAA)
MIGAELMRDVALLGARCVLATPEDQAPAAEDGWSAQPPARASLLRRMYEHELSDDPARVRLCDELGLDTTAYWLVMLCAAAELYPEAAAAISLVGEDAQVQVPTPIVMARLLRGIRGVPFAEALAAASGGGAAGRLGLVEVTDTPPGLPHSQHPLRLAKAEIAALHADPAGLGRSGELRLIRVPPGALAFAPESVAYAVQLLNDRRVVLLRGQSRQGARQFACDIASHLGESATLITPDGDLPGPVELARVRSGVLVLDLHLLTTVPPGQLGQLASSPGPLLVLVDPSVTIDGHAVTDSPAIGYPEALRIWSGVLDDAELGGPQPEASWMASRFRVPAQEAREAITEARLMHGPAVELDQIAHCLRVQGGRRMGRQITVIDSPQRLDDLVVPDPLRTQLDEIVAWHRSSHRVRWEMGLGPGEPTGTGLTCLLAGKSGTGKTFAARCLAGELGLNLYQIDLSQIVSKYIGETEKALGQVFDEAEAGHGLLLFDEADALFGRRSEVKDAHDRYANIEVGYLLQRLEAYDGIAVLTTNLQGNMDGAFLRRLRFILQFPAPDSGLRRRLWERSLPGPQWRAADLELGVLAERFQLTGGSIHNIGLAAAHLAAATPSGRITTGHVIRATQRELQKAGRPADASLFDALRTPAMNGAQR